MGDKIYSSCEEKEPRLKGQQKSFWTNPRASQSHQVLSTAAASSPRGHQLQDRGVLPQDGTKKPGGKLPHSPLVPRIVLSAWNRKLVVVTPQICDPKQLGWGENATCEHASTQAHACTREHTHNSRQRGQADHSEMYTVKQSELGN